MHRASKWSDTVRVHGPTGTKRVGIIGLRHVSKSRFDSAFVPSINSSMGVDLSACARVADALPAAAASASCTSPALLFSASAAHASVSPLHSNSWSDTVLNSRCARGLLLVCKSTSYTLGSSSQGPRGRRCTKGGVSGQAKDLRPVSEVEAGVNFRPAGGEQPSTGSRRFRVDMVTLSLHPKVPGTQFVSPGCGHQGNE